MIILLDTSLSIQEGWRHLQKFSGEEMRIKAYSTKHAWALSASAPRKLVSCLAALIAGVFVAGSAWALPSCRVSPSAIHTCCVADQAGQSYLLGQNLTSARNCIRISAPRVTFNMNGFSISSTSSTPRGIGVHILSTAPNAVFLNVSPPALISGFAVGFQSDAANTLAIVPNGVLGDRGVVFNGPNAFALEPVAEEDLKNGIILTPAASGSFMYGLESYSNGGNGIVLRRTTGVLLEFTDAEQNTGYGLWLKGSSSNSIIDGYLEGNTVAGAYLGCHAGGPSAAACSIPPSKNNTFIVGENGQFTVGSCPNGSQVDQQYGIVIDKGNAKNRVAGVRTDTNSNCSAPGDVLYDGFDGNPQANCRLNRWFANQLTIENHPSTAANPFCMDGSIL